MQEIISVPNSTFYLKIRNETAEAVIEKYTKRHLLMDIGRWHAAQLFISQGSMSAAFAPIAAQAPLIYQPLVKELSCIYLAAPKIVMQGLVTDAMVTEMASDLQHEFSVEFGPEFIVEMLYEIWPELGMGVVSGLLPVIGEVVVAILDATLTATLIWQIGTMTAIYFMNDGMWVTSKQETHRRARKLTGLPSPNAKRPGVLMDIPQKNPEINEKIMKGIKNAVNLMRERDSSITHEQMHLILREKGISDEFTRSLFV